MNMAFSSIYLSHKYMYVFNLNIFICNTNKSSQYNSDNTVLLNYIRVITSYYFKLSYTLHMTDEMPVLDKGQSQITG